MSRNSKSYVLIIATLFAAVVQGQTPAHAQSGAKSGQLGLDGYCPVCVVKGKGWVKGDPAFSSTYDGKTYRFPDAAVKEMFDASPSRFVPALGGDCVVCLKKSNKRVPGKVQHASLAGGRLFLFPDAEIKETFDANPAEFVDVDLASNGECVVCAVELGDKVMGSSEFTSIKDGMRYLFPGKDQMMMFVSNPAKYTGAATPTTGAYLEITLKIDPANRPSAAAVYKKYKQPFLDQIDGATSKTLLIRDDDVQVLHGFTTADQAEAYLKAPLFTADVVSELKPFLAAGPEVRIYSAVE